MPNDAPPPPTKGEGSFDEIFMLRYTHERASGYYWVKIASDTLIAEFWQTPDGQWVWATPRCNGWQQQVTSVLADVPAFDAGAVNLKSDNLRPAQHPVVLPLVTPLDLGDVRVSLRNEDATMNVHAFVTLNDVDQLIGMLRTFEEMENPDGFLTFKI